MDTYTKVGLILGSDRGVGGCFARCSQATNLRSARPSGRSPAKESLRETNRLAGWLSE